MKEIKSKKEHAYCNKKEKIYKKETKKETNK